jgi:cardiolipin synthase
MMLELEFTTALKIAATLISLVSFCFIPLVLIRRKEAASMVAWTMTLIFLPAVGVLLFWFFGRDRVRLPVRGKRALNSELRQRVNALPRPPTDDSLETLLAHQPAEQRDVMRLACRVGCPSIAAGNEVRVLLGAEATYAAQLEAIDGARDHVHLESYIFQPDAVGLRFRDALLRALGRGVRVRVLLDGFGSRFAKASGFFKPLVKAGGRVAKFFPLDPIRRAWSTNLRNHRKLLIVDGEVGFVGGINIGETFLPWSDVHLRIDGPAVAHMQRLFCEDWYFATRYDPVSSAFFPEIAERGRAVVQVVGSGPDASIEAIHRLYFAAIASARERVWITTPYFVPDRAILVALQTAAQRGVDVRLVLPRESNHRVTFHAGRSFYEELLAAGVHIHEFLPGMLHAKAMVVDGRFATVGSANFDVRSFRLNFELVAVLYDAPSVARLEAIFQDDLAQTEEVDHERWQERGWGLRVLEGVGRLFAPML